MEESFTKTQKCIYCNGQGITDFIFSFDDCEICNGNGWLYSDGSPPPKDFSQDTMFRFTGNY